MPQTIDAATLIELKRLISSKTGLTEFGKDDIKLQKFFTSRIKELALQSSVDYIKLLSEFGEGGNEELKKIAVELSNTETFFFRDHGQMSLLREKILPQLIEKNKLTRNLHIWSAACSSGEEIYSIAMILHELLPDSTDWNLELTGTDINIQALEKARKGLYTHWSFRSVPESVIREYFTLAKSVYHLKDKIRNLVTFKYFNLVADLSEFPGTTKERFDLIICRNVFIYFNHDGVEKAVNNFIKALKPEGYLLTGHSELANRHFQGLSLIPFEESFIYSKVDSRTESRSVPPARLKNNDPGLVSEPRIHLPKKRTAAKIDLPAGPVTSATDQLQPQIELKNETDLLALARTKANSGRLDEAKNLCDMVSEQNPFNPGSYFLLGQIANEQGELENAIALFNKVLYLNHQFFPASVELASIYDFLGEKQRAQKCRGMALEQLAKLDPEETVAFYQNMKVTEIIEEINKMSSH